MSDAAIVCTVLIAAVELLLMAFAVFCIGFFAGYRREENKIATIKGEKNKLLIKENKEEAKTKKNWQKFLNYDGSVNTDNTF